MTYTDRGESMTGAEFREIRDRLRLNQTDLARAMGTIQPTVSRWENTESVPSIPTRFIRTIEIAIQYGTPIERLIPGKE